MKVLIVDDQEINRLGLVGLLEGAGYTCVQAGSGEQALSVVRDQTDICMVLMDIVMPGIDGLDATREIRSHLGSNHIPIIFVTSADEAEKLELCFEAGGDDFVSRPINPTLLLSRLNAHQRLFSMHANLQESNKELLRHQRETEREHLVVEHVFDNVIKPAMTKCESISTHLSPYSMFNGDLYLAHRNNTGDIYVLLGDFTGHGLSAAIGCMPLADLFYAMAAKSVPVGEIVAEANRKLLKILPDHMFCCMVLMKFNATMDHLDIWVGGMNDIYMVEPSSKASQVIPSQHMPIGILTNEEFDSTSKEYDLASGARIFAYTDGVIEFQDPEGEMFGEDRLREAIEEQEESLIETVLVRLDDFKKGCEQRDDITLVEINTAKAPNDM
ncbi:PP2C family protein-serine/threonine phosphatase [Halioxenophilus aromaticivorans]|uniref:PP2C family protein-serine/threonine phosphatase n=1 Tax=Halioxenophilus aromaticivorans TaxID=1306992 RepID=UPI0031E7F904